MGEGGFSRDLAGLRHAHKNKRGKAELIRDRDNIISFQAEIVGCGRLTTPSPIKRYDRALCERRRLRLPHASIKSPAMQEDQRRGPAVFQAPEYIIFEFPAGDAHPARMVLAYTQ